MLMMLMPRKFPIFGKNFSKSKISILVYYTKHDQKGQFTLAHLKKSAKKLKMKSSQYRKTSFMVKYSKSVQELCFFQKCARGYPLFSYFYIFYNESSFIFIYKFCQKKKLHVTREHCLGEVLQGRSTSKYNIALFFFFFFKSSFGIYLQVAF